MQNPKEKSILPNIIHALYKNNDILSFDPAWQSGLTEELFNEQVKIEEMNEHTMTQLVYAQADLPKAFRAIPVEFIVAPMKEAPDGKRQRPNTGDTIKQWLSTNPAPGSCLAISHQPQVLYQNAVLKTFLPANFSIETVGATAQPDVKIGEMLDALARYLYQENEYLNKQLQQAL